MPLQTLLTAARERLSVAPGASVELAVSVQNLTSLLDQVALRLEGIDASWVQVIPPYLPVFAQGQASAKIVINPPRDSRTALAGSYPLKVKATSRVNPGQEGEANAILEIQLDGEYHCLLGQAEARNGETAYSLAVQNNANAPLTLHFNAHDAQEAYWFKFDPFELRIPAGQQSYVILSARQKQKSKAAESIAFTTTAEGAYELQGGSKISAQPCEVSGSISQQAPQTLRIDLQPNRITDTVPARYNLTISNPGTLPVNVNILANDPTGNLDLRCEPPQLSLAPQSDGQVQIIAYPHGTLVAGQRLEHMFNVTVQPSDTGISPVSAEAGFIHSGNFTPVKPKIPWLGIAIAAGVVLLVVVALIIMLPR
ncbi:MAG: COG1470 family protein [Anaerolineae bacterium]